MVNKSGKAEFNEERSRLYDLAMQQYPNARQDDICAMFKHLSPQRGERILGIGEGNGYFSKDILKAVGGDGVYTVTDPSRYQLQNLRNRVKSSNLEIIQCGAEELPVRKEYYDKVWSFGAFHHCSNQTEAVKKIYRSLKKGGSAVICDVFTNSKLADHFDSYVAEYSCTGHEVKFMSWRFAHTLCYLAGFENVKIEDLNQNWVFDSPGDMVDFLDKLHGITTRHPYWSRGSFNLDYRKSGTKIILDWPMKVVKAEK
jgi:arsenite methyltransferase